MAGALSGAVAHELNQPLSAMMSNARAALQFLAGGSADRQEIKDILADIESDGRRAGEVIRHLRSLLRRGEAQFETVHLDAIIDQVLRLIHSDLVSHNIKVVREPMAGRAADIGRLRATSAGHTESAGNACDALKSVNPRDRRISIGVAMRGPGRVRLSVSDNGCGLADTNPEHIFKPFVTTKRSGLGSRAFDLAVDRRRSRRKDLGREQSRRRSDVSRRSGGRISSREGGLMAAEPTVFVVDDDAERAARDLTFVAVRSSSSRRTTRRRRFSMRCGPTHPAASCSIWRFPAFPASSSRSD